MYICDRMWGKGLFHGKFDLAIQGAIVLLILWTVHIYSFSMAITLVWKVRFLSHKAQYKDFRELKMEIN